MNKKKQTNELTPAELKEITHYMGQAPPYTDDFKVLVAVPGIVLIKNIQGTTYSVEKMLNGCVELRRLGE